MRLSIGEKGAGTDAGGETSRATPSAGIIRFRFKGYFSAPWEGAPVSHCLLLAEKRAPVIQKNGHRQVNPAMPGKALEEACGVDLDVIALRLRKGNEV